MDQLKEIEQLRARLGELDRRARLGREPEEPPARSDFNDMLRRAAGRPVADRGTEPEEPPARSDFSDMLRRRGATPEGDSDDA
jgi:hypothetical protein